MVIKKTISTFIELMHLFGRLYTNKKIEIKLFNYYLIYNLKKC